jgi:hypothetical protein
VVVGDATMGGVLLVLALVTGLFKLDEWSPLVDNDESCWASDGGDESV